MPFQNREEAARRLAGRLSKWRGFRPLVMAVPRGAVPMGRIVADALEGDLDVVLAHKLGAPGNPEFAIGSIGESGEIYVSETARAIGIGDDYIAREAAAQMEMIRRRRALYSPARPAIDPSGRIVIVLDDGIATGATLIAGLRSVRSKRPLRLIAAAAVASPDALERIRPETDETVCLEAPVDFFAVGQFFREFPQVTDEEVVALLKGAPRFLKTGAG